MGEEKTSSPVLAEDTTKAKGSYRGAAVPWVQYATLGGTTLCILRAFNGFITHRQRGQTIVAAFGPGMILRRRTEEERRMDVIDELDRKIRAKDCESCRWIGTLSLAAIGVFIQWGTSSKTGYYATRPRVKMAVRSLTIAAFYLSVARFTYLPPFAYLKGHNDSITVHIPVQSKE